MVHKTLSAIALKDIYHGTLYHSSHLEILRQRRPGLREFVKSDVILTFRRVWKGPPRHRYVNRTPQILDTTSLGQHEYWTPQILDTTNNGTGQITGHHRYLGTLNCSWFPRGFPSAPNPLTPTRNLKLY